MDFSTRDVDRKQENEYGYQWCNSFTHNMNKIHKELPVHNESSIIEQSILN